MPLRSRTGCRVCFGPMRDEINALLHSGVPMMGIERQMKEVYDFPIKRETVGKHVKVCLGGDLSNIKLTNEGKALAKTLIEELPPGTKRDFAQLVHAEAVELLAQGRLRVSTKDGLTARALLDRREERAEERQFMLNLAQLLTGGGQGAPKDLIEGDFREIDDETPLLLDENPLLAPAELRGGPD